MSLPLTLTSISITRTRLYSDRFGPGKVQSVVFEEEEDQVTTYVMFDSPSTIKVRLASLALREPAVTQPSQLELHVGCRRLWVSWRLQARSALGAALS